MNRCSGKKLPKSPGKICKIFSLGASRVNANSDGFFRLFGRTNVDQTFFVEAAILRPRSGVFRECRLVCFVCFVCSAAPFGFGRLENELGAPHGTSPRRVHFLRTEHFIFYMDRARAEWPPEYPQSKLRLLAFAGGVFLWLSRRGAGRSLVPLAVPHASFRNILSSR